MGDDEIDQDFRAGRINRRAYVRRLLDGGLDMPAALARAEAVVPSPTPAATPSAAVPSPSDAPQQADDLEVNFVGDGYVVYDRERRRMHSLNGTAALVFELCTGEHHEAEIAVLLQRAFELPTSPLADVHGCLESLANERLIR